jgi:hypothetical protein
VSSIDPWQGSWRDLEIMTSVQEKLTDVILATIRSRRDDRTSDPTFKQQQTIQAPAQVSLRAAEFSDFASVARLGQRLGQGTDSIDNWTRLWIANPAVQSGLAASRIGWVLESGGTVVGFFGTIPLLCEFQGSTLVAAASCRFAVDPEFRSFSHLLVASFLRQKDVDLLLNTTATPAAGKMMIASKASPLPQEDYDNVLFWVLDSRHFMESVFRKLAVRPRLSAVGSLAGAIALGVEIRLRGRIPQAVKSRYTVSEHALDDLPPELDGFCEEQMRHTNRLLGKRNAAILQWHFVPPASQKVSRMLICWQGEQIAGYAIVRQEVNLENGLRRSTVADLLAANDSPDIIEALIARAHAGAKRAGSHVLEVMGFPGVIRQVLLQWNPYIRKYPSNPYFFKARDRVLHQKLQAPEMWYACPFDGDATLWP